MNGAPMFNDQKGLKYELWSCMMKVFLKEHGYNIWKSLMTGYNATKKSKTKANKELNKNTKKYIDFICEGLPDLVREKVGKFSSDKELWDKLHDIYFSPIIELDLEDTGSKHEERCSSCQTDLQEEECKVT
jgi:hypothetical protein